MRDVFTVQVRYFDGEIFRTSVNKNWTLNTLINNLELIAGGIKIATIGINYTIINRQMYGTKTLSEINVVPYLQLVVYQALNGGKF